MQQQDLAALRDQVQRTNRELLALLSHRARLVSRIQEVKTDLGIPTYSPEREQQMLEELVALNRGPFSDEAICHLFRQIFRASVSLMEAERDGELKVSRAAHHEDRLVRARGHVIGAAPVVIAGPCSVESEEQMERVGRYLAAAGVRFLRGGAFKPRSSPYSFQGLGKRGLELLRVTADRHGLAVVTEVMDTRAVGLVAELADVLQVGTRNMSNYDLLREVGRTRKPVLLKRGMAATIDELLWSAEYVVLEGNEDVVLCERGIRTFETQTRNTLDISAVPILRQQSCLPVVVDLSHAVGRRDILAPLGRAALAAGANGVMVEVHPTPAIARSDASQQLDLPSFGRFLVELGALETAPDEGALGRPRDDDADDRPGALLPNVFDSGPPPHLAIRQPSGSVHCDLERTDR